MRVEYAFISESADVQSGLFYVVRGGTDIWYAPAGADFPVPIGPMSFVVRLVGEPQEVGTDQPVEFTVVDAAGRRPAILLELCSRATDGPPPPAASAGLRRWRPGRRLPRPG